MLIQQGMKPYYDLSQDVVERLEKIGFLKKTLHSFAYHTNNRICRNEDQQSAQVSGTRMHHE